jgi:LysM repeat protein
MHARFLVGMDSPHREKVACFQPDRSKCLQLGLETLASSLLLSSLPVVLLNTGIGGILLLNAGNARAESPEDVAKIAQAITVRIEGATQGSGILVGHSGKRYTVLTAWHVVSSQQQGEELAIFAPDGREYQVVPGSIRRVANVDQAELSFDSSGSYAVAMQISQRLVGIGSTIFISGFPLPTSAVPRRMLRVMEGKIVASPTNPSDDGYSLLYSNPTMPGMSGGAILNDKGQLVGVHARSETQDVKTEAQDVYVKTGTGQGVPITYYQSNGAESNQAQVQVQVGVSTANLANRLSSIAQQPLATEQPANITGSTSRTEYITEARELTDWVTVKKTTSIERLSSQLNIDESKLARLNRVNEDHIFNPGDLLALPHRENQELDRIDSIDPAGPRLAHPLPQSLPPSVGSGVVRFGDTLILIAQRYGLTLAELLRLNPGLETARLVVGSQVRLAQSAPALRQRMLLGMNPVGSGGVNWPELPNFGPQLQQRNTNANNQQYNDSQIQERLARASQLLGQKGREKEVIELCDEVTKTKDNALAYYYRGYAKDDLGDTSGSMADLDRSASLNPDAFLTFRARGYVNNKLGKYHDALSDYNRANSLNPLDWKSVYGRGIANNNLNQTTAACSDFKKAERLGYPGKIEQASCNKKNVAAQAGSLLLRGVGYVLRSALKSR